jgi:hypothetical protein
VTAALAARGRAVLTSLALVLLALACGRAVVETQAVEADTGVLLLGSIGILAGLAVMVAGPVPCLAAIAALTIDSPIEPVSLGGGVDLTAADAFFAGLVGWWVVNQVGVAGGGKVRPPRSPISALPILLFLGFAGLSLLNVMAVDPGSLSVSTVSWLRVVQTATLGWLAATFIRTRRDVSIVLGVTAAAGAFAVVMSIIGGAGAEGGGPLGARGGGVLNANTLGLVSGFLILMAFFPAVTRRLAVRVPLAAIGCVGLVQSASVASIFGTVVALFLGLALTRRPKSAGSARLANALIALVVALALAYGLAALIRPENLPTSDGFFYESTGQRVILGTAGLEIFADNPAIGVGWHRSSNPEVVGDPAITTELRARFRDTRDDFFPDLEPLQVHSTYAQIPAELGVIGIGLLALLYWSVGRDVTRVARAAPRGSPEWDQLVFLAWALVLVVMWLNDNPIYGGQTESVTLALLVGMIAGLGRSVVASAEAHRPNGQPQASSSSR